MNGDVGAFHGHGRKKDAVGQIFQMVKIAADAHFALDAIIVRLHVGVIERPVFACAIVLAAFEIALAEAQGDGVPQHGFAAQAAAAFAIESRLAGLMVGM